MATRLELVEAIVDRYRSCPRAGKRQILDEFVAVTGYHRKHAIRVLRPREMDPPRDRRQAIRYGAEVREALVVLWEVSDRLCSKRLKPLIPVLLPALARHGRLDASPELRDKLLTVSAATIDRLLSEVRVVARGGRRRRTGMSSAVRRSVPIRTFGDWNDPAPGFVEVDFVAHSGTSTSGSFVQTLVLTDIATGWTECVPVRSRDSALVIAAIQQAQRLFPFPLLGVDFDNDSTFMNDLVVSWCRGQDLEVTRSRAYRKNDQAWVEQKNGAVVRRLVGYGRLVGAEATMVLTRLYEVVRLHGNLFQPSFKLQEKTRIGARVIKRYHPPVPPAARVLAHPDVTEIDKERLSKTLEAADPVLLFAALRAAQEELGKRVDRRGLSAKDEEPVIIDLQRFAANLATAWQAGETRPTHRRPYLRTKPYPKRPSMLDAFQSQIRAWIEDDPTLSATAVLERLIAADPARFTQKAKRTVQIAVKAWRAEIAGQIIINGNWKISCASSPPAAAGGEEAQLMVADLGNNLR